MEIKYMTEVMNASSKGKKIEKRLRFHENEAWEIDSNPIWDWSKFDYRIKKAPMFKEGQLVVCRTDEDTHAIHIRTWCASSESPYYNNGDGTYNKGYYREIEPYTGQSLTLKP